MSLDPLHNERELLVFISQGDEKAFAQVFNHYRNKIYDVAVKLTGSESVSEQIVQDVFLKVWLKKATITGVRDFDSWLFIVARNTIYSFLRTIADKNQTFELREEFTGLTNMADEVLHEKELAGFLQEAVEQLPLQQRLVYQLNKDQGLNKEEISVKMKIAPETVKKHLQYAMRSIRAFILTRLGIF